jgi:hypothetical protein
MDSKARRHALFIKCPLMMSTLRGDSELSRDPAIEPIWSGYKTYLRHVSPIGISNVVRYELDMSVNKSSMGLRTCPRGSLHVVGALNRLT